jgi:hypothetical protein
MSGPYTVSFEGHSGHIYFDGEMVAEISVARYSTSDRNFDDVLKHKENVSHFARIKELLRRVNRAD